MEENRMFPENGNIVIGVSGGPDSVCLLWLLCALRESHPLDLQVVHVDHGLRQESKEDALFVQKLCEEWGVPCRVVRADVAGVAAERKISKEEAGRLIRYEAFEKALGEMDEKDGGCGCVAVAHNRDDRAETLLFHLFRGTGLDGMASIRPVRPLCDRKPEGARVIRPLLTTGREEIEAFLKSHGISWRVDATNAGEQYARNRIRNRILPYARENVCPAANRHLAREAQLLEEVADFMQRQTYRALERCLEEEGDALFLDTGRLRRQEPLLQKACVRECLRRKGEGRDLTSAHVDAVWALAGEKTQSGRKILLPACRVEAVREFSRLKIASLPLQEAGATAGQKGKEGLDRPERVFALRIPDREGKEETQFVPGLGEVSVRLLPGPARSADFPGAAGEFFKNIPEKTYTKWFDYDNIIESVVFRTRRKQDFLTISDALEKKSLKRYMIEEKIPADQRDSLMLLADGSRIVWVPGHRIGAAYKVTAQTAVILEVHIRGGDEDERKSGSITDGAEGG